MDKMLRATCWRWPRLLCTHLLVRSHVKQKSGDMHGILLARGRVSKFSQCQSKGEPGTVIFDDGSNRKGIDCCVLATGYKFSFPFFGKEVLNCATPSHAPPLPKYICNSIYSILPSAGYLIPLEYNFSYLEENRRA